MECNKEEAIKAKEIAQKKMQNKDFMGARKIAIKAQTLWPELENISQILSVCNVHCAAENKMFGTEIDWYGVLQIEQTADETVIKKQYRKFALLLHPDKNKFAGAEAAFKLIGEAQRVLSDKGKRSLHDMKRKGLMRNSIPKPPPHQTNMNSFVRKQYGVQQQPGPGFSNGQQTFWTVCPRCRIRYQYYTTLLNVSLRCSTCYHSFVACEINSQTVPPPQQKDNLGQGSHSSFGDHPLNTGFQGNFGSKTMPSEPKTGSTSVGGGVSKTKGKDGMEKPKKAKPSGNMSRKRARKSEESSDSADSEEEAVLDEDGLPSFNGARKSTRQKQNVTYNENKKADDDDFQTPRKRSKSGSSNDTEMQNKEGKKVEKQKGTESSRSNGKDSAERSKTHVDSESKKRPKYVPSPEFLDYPDPDFNDFDKDRTEDCFATNQIWAVYDNHYGMPRYYARINKVYSPGFKVGITWLEPNPNDKDELDWLEAELPVACGKFKSNRSQCAKDRLMFSHLASWEKDSSLGSYKIYPRKGETWALFKSWDIEWKSNPDNHKEHKFEFVEVLSDYSEENGTNVMYLSKVKGFVSLFRPIEKTGTLQILPKELFRFSHRVPSCRMSSVEKFVPEGSFELDPAALPSDCEGFTHPINVQADQDKENTMERDDSKSKNESLKESIGAHKKSSEANGSHVMEDLCPSPAPLQERYIVPETEFYKFEADKSRDKFQPGQVWSIYSDEDCLPKYYARIKKIVSSPVFKVHITWLESFSLPENVIPWLKNDMPVSCGTFKLTGKAVPYGIESFSHKVKSEISVKNRYEIYPREGEVWALYKNWNPKWRVSDLTKCKHDIVEVLEENGENMKVLVLEKMEGFNFVYKASRGSGGSAVTMEIPRQELLRFSHQVPAFRLTKEKNGSLRGCWEVDPASLADSIDV